MINLKNSLTEQQLLYMAISVYVGEEQGSELYDISSGVIVAEAMKLLAKNEEEITTESVYLMSGQIIGGHVLEKLSLEGFVEESIEEPGKYKITQEGRDSLEKYE